MRPRPVRGSRRKKALQGLGPSFPDPCSLQGLGARGPEGLDAPPVRIALPVAQEWMPKSFPRGCFPFPFAAQARTGPLILSVSEPLTA